MSTEKISAILAWRGPRYRFPIEEGKIREFALATHAALPEYLDCPSPLIPPTFLTSAGFAWGYSLENPRDSGIDALGIDARLLLNGEEEFIYHRSLPRARDVLWAQTRFTNVRVKEGARAGRMTLYTLATAFTDDEGNLVAEKIATVIEVHKSNE